MMDATKYLMCCCLLSLHLPPPCCCLLCFLALLCRGLGQVQMHLHRVVACFLCMFQFVYLRVVVCVGVYVYVCML